MNSLAELFKSSKTIFTNKDIALILGETNINNLKSKINYYVKQGSLIRLSRGIFAKDENYNTRELAVNIYAPSYISFETALRDAGIIFQHYETIFIASKISRNKKIGQNNFEFRKIKDSVLFNPAGLIKENNYSIASPERAFLDTIYSLPNFYFDNLSSINWEKCHELVKIYNNKQLIKRLSKYQKLYAK